MPSRQRERDVTREIIDYAPPFKLDELPGAQALEETLPWPKKNGKSLGPTPIALNNRKPTTPLPKVDVVAVTWTVAEGFALGDVMTPGYRDVRPRKAPPKNTKAWYVYRPANFDTDYKPKLRKHAPALQANRLGSYCLTSVFNETLNRKVNVLCFKSELHLNRDWLDKSKTDARTMPVADLFVQIIDETQAKLIITVGTAGATLNTTPLGDVMGTRSAKFRLSKEFTKAPFNKSTYTCKTLGPLTAVQLHQTVPLLDRYKGYLSTKPVTRTPKIWFDGDSGSYDKYFPILTTDRFEFGTSKGKNSNYLGGQGCGVEMGDAVLGMVAQYLEKPTKKVPWEFALESLESLESAKKAVPKWLVLRNASDPQIDGNKSLADQKKEAVFFYKKYGYFTSVNSAIAVWAAARWLKF